MPDLTEQQLAKLIASLPPAPPGWVQAAQELPKARHAMDSLIRRAQADAQARQALLQDLEAALRSEGVQPRRELVQELHDRLSENR